MRERRDGLRLAREAGESRARSPASLLGQDLDRDLAAQPRVARPVDLAHPARAERGEDLVRPEPCSGGERHELDLSPSTK